MTFRSVTHKRNALVEMFNAASAEIEKVKSAPGDPTAKALRIAAIEECAKIDALRIAGTEVVDPNATPS